MYVFNICVYYQTDKYYILYGTNLRYNTRFPEGILDILKMA